MPNPEINLVEWTRIEIPGITIYVADRYYLAGLGLNGIPREDMQDSIMLFLRAYDNADFIMKDLGYEIDIAYLSSDYEILRIDMNVSDKSKPAKGTYRAVEALPGWFQDHNIKIGDRFPYRMFLRNQEKRYDGND